MSEAIPEPGTLAGFHTRVLSPKPVATASRLVPSGTPLDIMDTVAALKSAPLIEKDQRLGARLTGQKPSLGQFIGRYLAYFLAIIPAGIGLLWVAFDDRKQGWHDKLARTVLIRRTRHHGGPITEATFDD